MKLILLFSLLHAATAKFVVNEEIIEKLEHMERLLIPKGDFNNLMKKLEEITTIIANQGNEIKELKSLVKSQGTHNPEDPIADIVFIVDSSYRLSESDYRKELIFVQEMVNRFKISKLGTHAGLVICGNKSYMEVLLNDHRFSASAYAFNNLVEDAPLLREDRRFDLAFKDVQTKMFTMEGGARADAKPIIFLITSGPQYPPISHHPEYDPAQTLQILHRAGVKIVVIGINQYNEIEEEGREELMRIARRPSNFYLASNFEELIQEEFVSMVFKGETQGKIYSSGEYFRHRGF